MTQVPDSDEIRKERDEARRERDIAEAVMNRVIRERDKAREQLRSDAHQRHHERG